MCLLTRRNTFDIWKMILTILDPMTSRISRLWQPGNPQTRVFFPDFWIRVVETPKVGYKRLPKNAAKFEVDPRYDVSFAFACSHILLFQNV